MRSSPSPVAHQRAGAALLTPGRRGQSLRGLGASRADPDGAVSGRRSSPRSRTGQQVSTHGRGTRARSTTSPSSSARPSASPHPAPSSPPPTSHYLTTTGSTAVVNATVHGFTVGYWWAARPLLGGCVVCGAADPRRPPGFTRRRQPEPLDEITGFSETGRGAWRRDSQPDPRHPPETMNRPSDTDFSSHRRPSCICSTCRPASRDLTTDRRLYDQIVNLAGGRANLRYSEP